MKKARTPKPRPRVADDLLPEYDFDYRQSRPNRFAQRAQMKRTSVTLGPDVSKVFTSEESVNAVLRALITTMPRTAKSKATRFRPPGHRRTA